MSTGIKIRVLREKKQISREDMAELLGMSVRTYTRIENDEKEPTFKDIQLIADKFQVDPSFFSKKDNITVSNTDNSQGAGGAGGLIGGNGSYVDMDENLIKLFTKTLEKLNLLIDKILSKQ